MNTKYFIFVFFVLLLSISVASANEIDQNNVTLINDDSSIVDEINNVTLVNDDSSIESVDESDYHENDDLYVDNLQISSSQEVIGSDEDVIVVNNWAELQYYCAQTDKNYNLKLKENTNFYPDDPSSSSNQIKIKNNV